MHLSILAVVFLSTTTQPVAAMDDFEAARLILSNFPGCEGTCQTLVNVVAPLVKKHIWDRKLNESTHYMYLKGVPCVRTEHEKRRWGPIITQTFT
mmetsp:Transcript_23315/g.43637  ORF Transcript_23315/g.43637 Transcript_23315/m.43637 type:complete len:95 (+) Transcript_23315:63-347(+)